MIENRYHITESECWEWCGTRNEKGYGTLMIDGKRLKAHRVSYELYKGPIPSGLVVMHKCDNPPCVNPQHLEVGTNADNVADCIAKGRTTRGTKNGANKLSETDVQNIRKSHERAFIIAKRYSINPSLVSKIRTGRLWKYLPFPEGISPVDTSARKKRKNECKFTDEMLNFIRCSDACSAELARMFNVAHATIVRIRRGKLPRSYLPSKSN